ncbi:uncharacterized protein LOC144451544 [Glandiceps talaboti]
MSGVYCCAPVAKCLNRKKFRKEEGENDQDEQKEDTESTTSKTPDDTMTAHTFAAVEIVPQNAQVFQSHPYLVIHEIDFDIEVPYLVPSAPFIQLNLALCYASYPQHLNRVGVIFIRQDKNVVREAGKLEFPHLVKVINSSDMEYTYDVDKDGRPLDRPLRDTEILVWEWEYVKEVYTTEEVKGKVKRLKEQYTNIALDYYKSEQTTPLPSLRKSLSSTEFVTANVTSDRLSDARIVNEEGAGASRTPNGASSPVPDGSATGNASDEVDGQKEEEVGFFDRIINAFKSIGSDDKEKEEKEREQRV